MFLNCKIIIIIIISSSSIIIHNVWIFICWIFSACMPSLIWMFLSSCLNRALTEMNKSTRTRRTAGAGADAVGGVIGRCHRYLELCQCICMYSNCSWIIYSTAASAADNWCCCLHSLQTPVMSITHEISL